MTDIYDVHAKAFSNVYAYVVCKDGERIATIALKFPKDGAGRLTAFVHLLGCEMVKGWARGCGYDKKSAAIASCHKALVSAQKMTIRAYRDEVRDRAFIDAIAQDDGYGPLRALEDAGFSVFQAV